MKASEDTYRKHVQLLREVKDLIQSQFPMISRNGKTLNAENFRWGDSGVHIMNDFRAQKKAKLEEGSIVTRLVADVDFLDENNESLESRSGYLLLSIPHVTARDSYIIEGNEVQVVNQLRLRPGLYTSLKGDQEVETYLNTTAAGTYKVLLDRNTGIIRLKVGSDKKVPIFAVLRALGATGQDIDNLLGKLAEANRAASKFEPDTEKLLKALYPYSEVGSVIENQVKIKDFLASKPLDPAVNNLTVGKPIDKIDRSAIEAAVSKCIGVSNGTKEEDDIESLAFKSLHSVEDFIPERIRKAAPGLKRAIQYNMVNKKTIAAVIPSTLFGRVVNSFMTTSEFTRYSDQNNPVDIASINSTVTILGEGGISNTKAVKDSVRAVHASHFGVLDVLHNQEGACSSKDTEVLTLAGWKFWPDVTLEDKFATLDDEGRFGYDYASELHEYDFEGELYGFKSSALEFAVTPNHRMWVKPHSPGLDYHFVEMSEVFVKSQTSPWKVLIKSELPYEGDSEITSFTLPALESRRSPEEGGKDDALDPFQLTDWAEFLGWFLSVGSCDYSEKNHKYAVKITQDGAPNQENVARIDELLGRMFRTHHFVSPKDFTVSGRRLASYCKQFDKRDAKFIPREAFTWPKVARQALLEALMMGAGLVNKESGTACYSSTSKQLSEDILHLGTSLGMAGRLGYHKDNLETHDKYYYLVTFHKGYQQDICANLQETATGYYKKPYSDKVYCATVPGSRLYTRLSGKGGFWSGNSVGITQHLALGAKKVGNSIHLRLFNAKTGQSVEKSVEDAMRYIIAFPDQYTGIGKGIPKVKPSYKVVKVRHGSKLMEADPKEVQYIFNDSASFFGSSSNIVPFLPSNTANRVLMGNKHIEQSVHLANPDKPLVQHRLKTNGKGFVEMFGEGFLVTSPIDGVVKKIKSDSITIKGANGSREVLIHDHFPLNSKTFLHDTPIVKVGQKVSKGEALVNNNFTKDKTLALGKNLSVAMIPYKGYNFEDGTVITEAAARKLSSVHKEEYRVEKNKLVTIDMERYLAQFPKMLEEIPEGWHKKYDSKGVIKKGQIVRKDQILIPAIREVSLRKTALVDLHKKILSNTYADISSIWDKDVEGEVVDVVHDRKFVKIIVKSVEPAVVGDKISAFAGAKGIITKILGPDEVYRDARGKEIDILFNPMGSFSSDTEMLTKDGWKLIKEVNIGDKVMAMDPVTQEARMEEILWTRSYEWEGPMYKVRNKKLDLLVTPDHEMYSRKSSKVRHPYEKISATDTFGLRRNYKKNCESWAGVTPKFISFREKVRATSKGKDASEVDPYDFALFIGLLVGDGWATKSNTETIPQSPMTWLCQHESKAEVCKVIQGVCDSLPWHFTKSYRKDSGMFYWQCRSKVLNAWLLEHMKSGALNKRIPRELLSWGTPALKLMLDGLIMTGGNVKWNKKTGHYGTRRYFTSSKMLADDVQELILRTGASAHITKDLRPAGSGFSDHDSLIYTVHELKCSEPNINWSGTTKKNSTEEWRPYDGMVHCVTVPSGLIYVRRSVSKIPSWQAQSVGRINPGFLLEAGAGKVAQKSGKTFYVDNFNTTKGSNLKLVQDELKKAGIDEEETITCDATGHKIHRVLVGPIHTLKLKHKISSKFSARGATGSAYTTLEQPKKESGESAQRVAGLTMFTLLAGDATSFLDDAYRIKGQKNDDYWTALQLGHTLPAPKTPFVAEKFIAMLLAAGVNLNQTGSRMSASPMTDEEILRISHGEVQNASTLKAPALTPMKGGLFDPEVTGGIAGNKFSHIKLTEPIINPLMKEAVISVGGFSSGVEVAEIILGKKDIRADGSVGVGGGKTGIEAIIERLDSIDVGAEISKTAVAVKTAKATALNKGNRRLRYLKALRALKMKPSKAYINKYVAVLPPKFRQITEMPDGSITAGDSNFMYREVLMVNNQMKDLKNMGFDNRSMEEIRTALYDATTASVGLGPSLSKGRQYRGLIEEINGANESKYGYFKSKVVSRPQDLSARSTIIPNPKLDMDYVGIPRKMAFKIYQPFVVRRLVQNGFTALKAKQMLEEQSSEALSALQEEVEHRPVLMNRAPELHKFNMLSFKVVLTDGKAIETNPLIIQGMGADFDGDQILDLVLFSVKNDLLATVKGVLQNNTTFLLATGFVGDYSSSIQVSNHVDQYFKERTMCSRTNTQIPVKKDGTVYVCDLADFPHIEGPIKASIGYQGNLIAWHDVPAGVEALAHDEATGELSWTPVKFWTKHVDCPVDIVSLSNGRQMFTDNDPRAVYGMSGDGNLEMERFRPKAALAANVMVPCTDELNFPEDVTEFTFKHEDMVTAKERSDGKTRHLVEGSITLTTDITYSLGALIGDGWCTESKMVCLSGIQPDVVDATEVGLNHLMTKPLHRGIRKPAVAGTKHAPYGESLTSVWSVKELAQAIKPLIGHGAANKHMPAFAFNIPKDMKKALIAGMIDTDGSITVCKAKAKKKSQTVCNYSTNSLRLARELMTLCRSLGIKAGVSSTVGSNTGNQGWVVTIQPWALKQAGIGQYLQVNYKAEALAAVTKPEDTGGSARYDAVPCPSPVARAIKQHFPSLSKPIIKLGKAGRTEEQNAQNLLAFTLTTLGCKKGTNSMGRYIAQKYVDLMRASEAELSPIIEKWIEIVENKAISWSRVIKVEETGIRETGYDLTVPGFETFTASNGVVLSNTMGVHVPVSEAARKEALTKMLPSRHLISPRADFVMHMPSKETVLGVYMLTSPKGKAIKVKSMAEAEGLLKKSKLAANTAVLIGDTTHCVGQKIVNDVFPAGKGPGWVTLDAKQLEKVVLDLSRQLSEDKTAAIISKLKDLGNHYVTELGFAVSLKDLEFDYDKRDTILDKLERTKGAVGFERASETANDELMALLAEATDNRFVEATLSSKATGKGGAVRQMIATPIAISDSKGELIPFSIKKSYAEGHDLGSYLGTTPGARQGLVDKGISVAKTGYLSRVLVNSNIENRITTEDCGSLTGVKLSISDGDVVHRYGAEGLLRNQLLTPEVLNDYKRKTKNESILVRSALTCKATSGICQMCAGVSSDGKPYNKGFHIGVLAAQAVGERATQVTLSCNAGEGVIKLKEGYMTFIEVWDKYATDITELNGVQSCCPEDLEVWDGHEWASVENLQKHLPSYEVVEQVLGNGQSYKCQGNHPTYASELGSTFQNHVKIEDTLGMFIDVFDGGKPVGREVVVSVEVVEYTDYVYDFKTSTGRIMVNQMQSSNSFHCSLGTTLCLIRKDGKVQHSTLASIYESNEVKAKWDGHEWNTSVNDVEVWDNGRWVRVLQAKKHPQESGTAMMMCRTRSGHAIISQDNHPHMLRENNIACIRCGVWPKRHTGSGGGYYCKKCNRRWAGLPTNSGPFSEVEPRDIKRKSHEALVDVGPTPDVAVPSIEDGRVAGLYSRHKALPDGWSGYSREWLGDFVSGVIDSEGTKQRHNHSAWISILIETTSWLLSQQLIHILNAEGITCQVRTSPWRKESLNQGYKVSFVLSERAGRFLNKCYKIEGEPLKPEKKAHQYASVVDYTQPIKFLEAPDVYDITTESGTFFANSMWTHNSAGAVGGTKVGFDRIKQLFHLPKVGKGRAVLAETSGVIQRVESAPAGGSYVTLNNKTLFVPQELGVKVKVGDPVVAGQQISLGGSVNPQDLLAATGDIHNTREVMIEELQKAYAGQSIKRRVFETVVKPMTDKARVTDQGDASIYNVYNGETHLVSHLDDVNSKLKLRNLRPVTYEAVLLGISQIPHLSSDFFGQLTHERLKDSIKNAPATGIGTDMKSGHPVSQLILRQFGHVEDIKNPRTKLH